MSSMHAAIRICTGCKNIKISFLKHIISIKQKRLGKNVQIKIEDIVDFFINKYIYICITISKKFTFSYFIYGHF